MTSLGLLVLLVTALGLVGYLYLARTPAVEGRALLLGLRAGAIFVLVFLLLDLRLPGADESSTRDPARWVLLDASAALDVPADSPDGGTLREVAVALATEAARGGARLALTGPEPEGIDSASLRSADARPTTPDLRPSLLRLAEGGADSILLLSPFRTGEATLARALDELPVTVRLEQVGGRVRNAGVLTLDLPRQISAGEEVEGVVVLFGEGGIEGDSVEVQLQADGSPVESLQVPLPPAGAPARLELRLPAPPDTGWVRYTARVALDGDVFAQDDERARRVRVGPPEGGILLVSLRPDWEPRVILPVLEGALGLQGEGYLRVAGEDRWLPLGDGEASAFPVGSDAFRYRLEHAALLVVHGAGGTDRGVPPWLPAIVEGHPRVLHLPAGAAGFDLAGVSAGTEQGGDWSLDPSLPPSPVAPFLSGLSLAGLPPLVELWDSGDVGGTVALRVRTSAGAESLPALLLRERPGGRDAVAFASGFWRWGNRTGAPREVYRGLWSGVAGWLAAAEGVAGPQPIRPLEPVVARSESFEWLAPDGGEGVLTLRFEGIAEDESEMGAEEERVVRLDAGGRGRAEPLPPGRWRWTGSVEGGRAAERAEDDPIEGEGEVEVETWVDALATPPLDSVPARVEAAERVTGTPGVPEGRPLRTFPLPYLLLLGLLCAEWVLRRRVGLR
ncbi:MAG: hypothetical protein WD960_01910 [Gemmatimonadota bacterium]